MVDELIKRDDDVMLLKVSVFSIDDMMLEIFVLRVGSMLSEGLTSLLVVIGTNELSLPSIDVGTEGTLKVNVVNGDSISSVILKM